MNRAEHLQWAKDRATEYCDAGNWKDGWLSFTSDMSKHPELSIHSALGLGHQLLLAGHMNTPEEVRKFILGFN